MRKIITGILLLFFISLYVHAQLYVVRNPETIRKGGVITPDTLDGKLSVDTLNVDLRMYSPLDGFFQFSLKYDTISACDGKLPAISASWAYYSPLDDSVLYFQDSLGANFILEDSVKKRTSWIRWIIKPEFTDGLQIIVKYNDADTSGINTLRKVKTYYNLKFR